MSLLSEELLSGESVGLMNDAAPGWNEVLMGIPCGSTVRAENGMGMACAVTEPVFNPCSDMNFSAEVLPFAPFPSISTGKLAFVPRLAVCACAFVVADGLPT